MTTINLPVTCKEIKICTFVLIIVITVWGTLNFNSAGENDPLVFFTTILGWLATIIFIVVWSVFNEDKIANALPKFRCKCDKK